MKILILSIIATFLLADSKLIDGLERASAEHKRDACALAKKEAKKNYDVKEMNAGCNCEISDAREWMCFVKFKHLSKEN
ncbi:hypothetical protein [Sulfurimonas sp.]|uniref:hypothetical protein n=1 Tax=Sulfurimonas sp. TaxID=2022749 RepID=UPI003566F587